MPQPTEVMPQHTQPMPQPVAPDQQAPQAYPAASPHMDQPPGTPQYGAAPVATAPTPPKSGPNIAVIIGVVVGALILMGVAITVLSLVLLPRLRGGEPAPDVAIEQPVATEPTTPAAPASPAEGAFASAEEAARSELPDGYVLELAEDSETRKVYWSGPPASEWDAIIVVENAGGGWMVTEASAFNAGAPGDGATGGEDGTSQNSADAARDLVGEFLNAIKEDRPNDAQSMTISPFRDDPASAQYSNGQFTRFTVDEVVPRDDGTFWVDTTEVWTYGTDRWRYDVVPTEAGLRIRDLKPAQ